MGGVKKGEKKEKTVFFFVFRFSFISTFFFNIKIAKEHLNVSPHLTKTNDETVL